MSISKSFPWKKIEEKPQNYEIVRILIEDVASVFDKSVNNSIIKQPDNLLKYFIKHFNFDAWFSNISFEEKTTNLKKKDKIIAENEKNQIEKDFSQFIIDPNKHLMEIRFFLFETSSIFYLFVWFVHIYENRTKIKKKLLLDAIISSNRLLDSNILTNPNYIKGFQTIQEKMQKLVSDKMYDTLFSNPKLMIDCTFQQQRKNVQLYAEQKNVLSLIHDKIQTDAPLLIGNQMPTGQGKSFLSVPLAYMLSKERRVDKKKCVLFACPNELVNEDVASNALVGCELHLWLAKVLLTDVFVPSGEKDVFGKDKLVLKRQAHVLLRPYKRCFPSTWKQVYKKKEDEKLKNGSIEQQWKYYVKATGKVPDIVVADLESCYELLKHKESLMITNELCGNPFVAYIDEFNTTRNDNEVVAKICHYLPKQSVILSSILPRFEHIPSVVDYFCNQFKTTEEESCVRICSSDVNIPCVIIGPDGYVYFAHHLVKSIEQLDVLIEEIKTNPRIRRTYSPKHVYFWIKSIEHILPSELKFEVNFPNIGMITLKNVVTFVEKIFCFWRDTWGEHNEVFQSYKPKQMHPVELDKIFTKQSIFYEGKTLFTANNIDEKIPNYTKNLYSDAEEKFPHKDYIKIDKLLIEQERKKKNLDKAHKSSVHSTKSKQGNSKERMTKLDSMMRTNEINEQMEDTDISIPKEFIINSNEHFEKFHPNVKNQWSDNKQVYLENEYFSSFSNDEIYQMFSGIGIYSRSKQTDYQRQQVMQKYSKFSFFCSGMDVVYGTNLAALENIVIDAEFASTTSIPTLYQLMGRVGRIGRSYHANIITTDMPTVSKLLSMDQNCEIDNDIENCFLKSSI